MRWIRHEIHARRQLVARIAGRNAGLTLHPHAMTKGLDPDTIKAMATIDGGEEETTLGPYY